MNWYLKLFENSLKRILNFKKQYCSSTTATSLSHGKNYKKRLSLPKKASSPKVAILLGYDGHNFAGMQKNEGVVTVEGKLLEALLHGGLISEEAYYNPSLVSYERASRTDKGVSAAFQIVNFRLCTEAVPGPAVVRIINENLPPTIRVFGCKRVPLHFDCHMYCESRTYSYMLPSYAFAPMEQLTTEDYKISDTTLNEVRDILKEFVGVHHFHNFTSGITLLEKSSRRTIFQMEVSEPFVAENIEFVKIFIKGRSFLLHQIRKMIALIIAVVRGVVSRQIIEQAWELERRDFPRAPGLGLVLEKINYNAFDKYCGNGKYEQLLWDDVKMEQNRFAEQYIYSRIAYREKTERSTWIWLPKVFQCTYDVRHPDVSFDTEVVRSPLGKLMYCLEQKRKEEAIEGKESDEESDGYDSDDETDVAKNCVP